MTATHEPRVEPLQAAPPGDRDRLTEETAKLRGRGEVPVDRWFQRFGAAVMALGLLAIVAGWYGVAHTARQWRQAPYIVSGGILGLALVFIGAFAYFAYWLTRLVEQTQRQTAVLERLEAHFGSAAAGAGDAEEVVLAGGILHRGNCPLLTGRSDVKAPSGREKNLRACPVCEPPLP